MSDLKPDSDETSGLLDELLMHSLRLIGSSRGIGMR
jgi:hypothetical protein